MTIKRYGAAAFGAVAAVAALAATAGPALADGPASTTYKYTGAPQTVTVPADAVAVAIRATGGSGADGDKVQGGHAATVTGYAAVRGGSTLTVDVGGAGRPAPYPSTPGAGGWGYARGGAGGASYSNHSGGGGGGSSALVRGDAPLVIAAGGGGSGGDGGARSGDGAGAGGNAGGEAGAGGSSALPGAGGRGGVMADGPGEAAKACATTRSGGGGGGGGAGLEGGAAGGCGGFQTGTGSSAHGGGGGGGAGMSLAPSSMVQRTTEADAPGDGSVTLTWYTAACQAATVLVDSTTPTHAIELPPGCAGGVPVAAATVADHTGVGQVLVDRYSGAITETVAHGKTGVGWTTLNETNVFGDRVPFVLTSLVAPGGRAELVSGGLAADAGNGDLANPVLAETPTSTLGQQWSLHDGGDGTFTLVNEARGACLTTDLASAPGSPFTLDTCGYGIPTRVRISADAEAGARLVDADSGLPIGFSSAGPGAALVLGKPDDRLVWSLANPATTADGG